MVAPEDRNLPESQDEEYGVFGAFSDYTGKTTSSEKKASSIPSDARKTQANSESSRLSQILSGGMGGAFDEIDVVAKSDQKPGAESSQSDFNTNPDDLTVIYCRKYPDKVATSQCPKCQAYFCSEAMTIYKNQLVCVDCADDMRSVALGELSARKGIEHVAENQKHQIIEDIPDFDPSGRTDAGYVSSPYSRLYAGIIDIIFIGVFSFFVHYFMSLKIGGLKSSEYFQIALDRTLFQTFPNYLLNFLVAFIYIFLLYLINNRTLGMKIVGLRIISVYGDFAGLVPSLIRSLLVIVTNIFGWIFCFFNQYRQELPDLLANTCVINYSGSRAVDPNDDIQIKTYD